MAAAELFASTGVEGRHGMEFVIGDAMGNEGRLQIRKTGTKGASFPVNLKGMLSSAKGPIIAAIITVALDIEGIVFGAICV